MMLLMKMNFFFGEMNFEDFDVGFDKDYDSEELEEDLVDFLSLDFIMNSLDLEDAKDFDVGDLEQGVGGMSFEKKDNGVFYKIFDNLGELYTSEVYEGSVDEEISSKHEDFSDFNELNRDGRSMLEIAGFRDFDMEKKRERKWREFW